MDWRLWWRQMKMWGKNKQTNKTKTPTPTPHTPPPATKAQNKKKKIAREKSVSGTDNLTKYLQNLYWMTLLSIEMFTTDHLLILSKYSRGLFSIWIRREGYTGHRLCLDEKLTLTIIHQLVTPSVWMALLWVSGSQVLYVVYIFAVTATIMLFCVTELQYY